ncbi:hypothetical protein, partial [Elizabethkingia miricola]|uniref:hypothetical protein n=1 Tax=Elizabethkingia miricola TaxID=172045 RepID=UPI001CA40587
MIKSPKGGICFGILPTVLITLFEALCIKESWVSGMTKIYGICEIKIVFTTSITRVFLLMNFPKINN